MKYDIVSERTDRDIVMRDPADIYHALQRYSGKRQEHFFVVTLRGDHSIIRVKIVSIGLVNRTVVHPREVFIQAIKDNSCAIIVAHNHPSGRLDPSPEDREITARLTNASEVIGIAVLDHLIISKSGYYSFVEHGLMSLPAVD